MGSALEGMESAYELFCLQQWQKEMNHLVTYTFVTDGHYSYLNISSKNQVTKQQPPFSCKRLVTLKEVLTKESVAFLSNLYIIPLSMSSLHRTMEVFAEVLYFITLALFYALSGNHNFTILTSFRLL